MNNLPAVTSIVQIIHQAKSDISRNFLTIGRALQMVKENDLWKGHNDSFEEFCMELGFSKSSAYNMMGVYTRFGNLNVEGIEYTRMVRMLPLNIQGEEQEEWIEKAKVLKSEDFHNEVREKQGKPPTDQCDHDDIKLIRRCRCCGKWFPDCD